MHLTGSSPNCILPKDYRIKTTQKKQKISKDSKDILFNTHQLAYLGDNSCTVGNQAEVKIPK